MDPLNSGTNGRSMKRKKVWLFMNFFFEQPPAFLLIKKSFYI